MSAAHTPSRWRIERNAKMHFCVARDTQDGKEFRLSASGKPSSFKTWAAAKRVMVRLNEDADTEAYLRAKYAGLPPLPVMTLASLAKVARGAA